jgi:6-phosphogluconolactonase
MPSRVQSRREFIAASTAGILAMTVSSGEFPADSVLFYVGTYTDGTRSEGIYLVRMNTRTGELELLSVTDAGPNPSFLAVHPSGRALYAANEATDGGVSAFAISEGSGALTRINRQPSGGSGPCFVSVDRTGRAVLVANYDSGAVALLPSSTTGTLGAPTSIARDSGGGPNAERQEAPHAHCILAEPSNRFALAADLGADRVFVYELDIESGSLRHREDGGDAVMRAGAGPRHIAFHPTEPLVFVSCELDSTVATLRFDVIGGTLTLVATTTTLPQGWKGENYPADIHVAPSGNALYVSNRGHDSIAVFSIGPAGALRREQHVSTEGSWPRNFSLDPSGRWLLVANQKSSSIVVFARDAASGRLTRSRRRLEVPSPACIRFRASAPG